MNNPVLSFIIPCFHSEKTIVKTINSIVSQFNDYKLFEVILVAKDEKDTSFSAIDNQFNSVVIKKYYSREVGVSANRNKGLSVAKGDYVYFLDSDDTLFQNKENIFLELIKKHPNYDVYFGQTLNFNDTDTDAIKKHDQILDKPSDLDSFFGDFGIVNYSYYSYLFRKDFLINNNCFVPNELTNSEDYYFVGLFMTKQPRMFISTNYFCVYTLSNVSLSKDKSLNTACSSVTSFLMLFDILESAGFIKSLFRFRYNFVQTRLDYGIYLTRKDKVIFLDQLKKNNVKNKVIKKTVIKKKYIYLIFGYRISWHLLKIMRLFKTIIKRN